MEEKMEEMKKEFREQRKEWRKERGVKEELGGDEGVGGNKEEIREAIRSLKDGKAAGCDGIPGEVWKYGGEEMMEWGWHFCNRVWKGEGWPEGWKEGEIVPM